MINGRSARVIGPFVQDLLASCVEPYAELPRLFACAALASESADNLDCDSGLYGKTPIRFFVDCPVNGQRRLAHLLRNGTQSLAVLERENQSWKNTHIRGDTYTFCA
jgi:hypothetical protein